ncbi:MAG: class I SAM-dependent methyltransferase, partial [Acidimicrobiales bacterium]|nr:class I SAM-dependent methyltransferase [Acidimicrobiales bacterium]
RYHYGNRPYPWGDGVGLGVMLRHIRPRRFVEIGSGWSTLATLDISEHFLDGEVDITTVDPYPRRLRALLGEQLPPRLRLVERPVQDIDPIDLVGGLSAGDVVFVDSTHVVKTGSDVNHIVFELFPRLAPGVHVHVHDLFPGFEYPRAWVLQGRAWSEAYLLRAFLMFNDAFEVTFWLSLLAARRPDWFAATWPAVMRNPGGSIWLTRRNP